jgi:hypothetical protein
VTCSWFAFNAVIVTHLLEFTFEFAHIPVVKDNKLRLRVPCKPGGVMKQTMDGCQISAGSIIVSANRQCVLDGVLIVNGPTRSTQTMIQGQILLFWVGADHISYAPSLSIDILDKRNINNQCSSSCVRPGHVMVFLIVVSVLVCPR